MQHKLFVKAFTLIEVMISVAIVSVIAAVVLFNYSTFSDNLSLSAAAQEVVLDIRRAQTYGLSVKEATAGGGQFDSAYGVRFEGGISATNFVLFVDRDRDGQYDAGGVCGTAGSECVENIVFRDGVTIASIHGNGNGTPGGADSLEFTFLRPNPDAIIQFLKNGSVVATPTLGRVKLISKKGKTLFVAVLNTGQISIQ